MSATVEESRPPLTISNFIRLVRTCRRVRLELEHMLATGWNEQRVRLLIADLRRASEPKERLP